jgi:hypothetical protein
MQAARIQMPFFMFIVQLRKTATHHSADATPLIACPRNCARTSLKSTVLLKIKRFGFEPS